jgi:hypothetical protein
MRAVELLPNEIEQKNKFQESGEAPGEVAEGQKLDHFMQGINT